MSTDGPHPGDDRQARVISGPSALGICIASMIGAGIFTVTGTIGFELVTPTNLMIGWVIGGLVALCGGFAVAELAAMRPRASAQYEVVHEALGPSFGFLKGMITLLVGYISSLAAVAMVAGEYIENVFPTAEPRLVATLLLVGLSAVHAFTVIGGQRFNDLLVAFKITLVLAFIVFGFMLMGDPLVPSAELLAAARAQVPDSALGSVPVGATAAETLAHLRAAPGPAPISAPIGLAVVSITFAYLGWATAAEVAGEIRRPGRNLPLAILGSVALVGGLYLLVNLVYIGVVPPAAMVELADDGTLAPMSDIGSVVATHLLGERGGLLVTLAIVFLFISTLSVGVMTGGRVIAAMSWRNELPESTGILNRRGAPSVAIGVMLAGTLPIIWISGLSDLFEYVGLLTTIAVIVAMTSVIVMRIKAPDLDRPFRIPLYPIPPLISIGIGGWLIASATLEDGWRVFYALLTLIAIVAARPLLARPRGKDARSN